jgi:hypothetical protein
MCCILRGPGRERMLDVVPRGTELGSRVKTGSRACRTHSIIPQVECTGVLLCVIREHFQLQLNCIGDKSRQRGSSLPLTHWSSSFILCCSVTVRDTQQTATGAQGSYCYVRQSTHCSRYKHLARPVIKKNKIEGTDIPPLLGLFTERWKCKQTVWVTDRRELSMTKLSLWLAHSTYVTLKDRKRSLSGKKRPQRVVALEKRLQREMSFKWTIYRFSNLLIKITCNVGLMKKNSEAHLFLQELLEWHIELHFTFFETHLHFISMQCLLQWHLTNPCLLPDVIIEANRRDSELEVTSCAWMRLMSAAVMSLQAYGRSSWPCFVPNR